MGFKCGVDDLESNRIITRNKQFLSDPLLHYFHLLWWSINYYKTEVDLSIIKMFICQVFSLISPVNCQFLCFEKMIIRVRITRMWTFYTDR